MAIRRSGGIAGRSELGKALRMGAMLIALGSCNAHTQTQRARVADADIGRPSPTETYGALPPRPDALLEVPAIASGSPPEIEMPIMRFDQIRFDNGAEIGINNGRTMYFNGISRQVNPDGTITIGGEGISLDWSQSFGFDTNGGTNGELARVGNNRYIELIFTGSLGEAPIPGQGCKGCFRLEITDQDGQTHQLWIRHESAALTNRFQLVSEGVYRAEIPEGVTQIVKVQFVGYLTEINMTLHSLSLTQ